MSGQQPSETSSASAALKRLAAPLAMVVSLALATGAGAAVIRPAAPAEAVEPGVPVVTLTFDDGNIDQLLGAEILDRHGLDGTFYVQSGALNCRTPATRSAPTQPATSTSRVSARMRRSGRPAPTVQTSPTLASSPRASPTRTRGSASRRGKRSRSVVSIAHDSSATCSRPTAAPTAHRPRASRRSTRLRSARRRRSARDGRSRI